MIGNNLPHADAEVLDPASPGGPHRIADQLYPATPHCVGQHGTVLTTDVGLTALPAGSHIFDASRISDPGQSAPLDRDLQCGGRCGSPQPRAGVVRVERLNQPERRLLL